MDTQWSPNVRASEQGAALITVILISALLLTATIAMLTALAAGAKATSDVLSETKAYYAAESGLQSTINVLRNDTTISYKDIAGNPSLVTNQLYNWPVGTPTRAVVGQTPANYSAVRGSGYEIAISDPDNTSTSTTYRTVGSFEQSVAGTYAATRVFTSGGNTLTVSYVNQSTTTVGPLTGTPFGGFQITGTGTIPAPLKFRIDYITTTGLGGTRTIRGTIATNGVVTFVSNTYSLGGATITLCATTACTSSPNMTLPIPTTSTQALYAKMTATEPYRMLVTATGYGPNGSRKQLEGIIQRNFFNDFGSSAAISMVGPNAYFTTGTSAQMQINGGSNPSITVSDAAGLATIQANHTNGTIVPPPEIAGSDVPSWQQSTAALDALIQNLRATAQSSGRYFDAAHPPTNFGNFSSGTGITFCEGSCNMGGNSSGGGILVVTGTFSTSGNPQFNGLVLAVGQYVSAQNPGGVVRNGGGNEIFTGNIVIAPYNPNNLASGFLQPRYDQNGGPGDTINSDVTVDQTFDGTAAISDFMVGVAEK